MKFSPRYATFFPDDLRADALPADVIEVPDEIAFQAQHRSHQETLVVTDNRLYIVPAPTLDLTP